MARTVVFHALSKYSSASGGLRFFVVERLDLKFNKNRNNHKKYTDADTTRNIIDRIPR